MASSHPTHRVDLSGPTLLIGPVPEARPCNGPGVDVALVDLNRALPGDVPGMVDLAAGGVVDRPIGSVGGSPAAVTAAVEVGIGLIILDPSGPADEVLGIAFTAQRADIVVVISGPRLSLAVATSQDLISRGFCSDRLVVEVQGPDGARQIARASSDALEARFGASVSARSSAADTARSDHAVGYDIGLLTALVSHGAATVRGADPRMFARVRRVVEAADTGGSDADASEPVPPMVVPVTP